MTGKPPPKKTPAKNSWNEMEVECVKETGFASYLDSADERNKKQALVSSTYIFFMNTKGPKKLHSILTNGHKNG
jgi:hypothetical protein